jgi:hypothetical protein
LSALYRPTDPPDLDGQSGHELGNDDKTQAVSVSEANDPLKRAVQTTNDFIRYYHHAVPFSRRVLEERWEDCEAAPALRASCIDARAIAQRALGRLKVGGT